MNSNRVLFVLLTAGRRVRLRLRPDYRGHLAGNRDRLQPGGCAERGG